MVDSVLQASIAMGMYIFRGVSILVLVDSVLQDREVFQQLIDIRTFQSLFWWIQYFRLDQHELICQSHLVSILVLVDSVLQEMSTGIYQVLNDVSILVLVDSVLQDKTYYILIHLPQSFNPCFGGFSTSGAIFCFYF